MSDSPTVPQELRHRRQDQRLQARVGPTGEVADQLGTGAGEGDDQHLAPKRSATAAMRWRSPATCTPRTV